ncbi:MAG: hypothetical protein ACUVQ1_06750 [Candidatus Kapaibacteriales bacterium]
MKYSTKFFLILLLILLSLPVFSQTGIPFSEFKNKLQGYFIPEMISDLEKNLPQRINFTIWGWDIGDYSGDGNPDLAFTIKISQEKRKVSYAYFFVDIDGTFELVLNKAYEYIELPLEIGISIKNNSCSITQKKKNDHWVIETYRFENGIIYLLGTYSAEKSLFFFLETNVDYLNCRKKVSYENISSGGTNKFISDFIFIPSYPRRKEIFKGYPSEASAKNIDYVIKGSYYWLGERDASFTVHSSFDDKFIYLSFYFLDDYYIPKTCTNCLGDELHLWFDFNPVTNTVDRIFKKSKSKFILRNNLDENIYQIQITLGNFLDDQPKIQTINSNVIFDEIQKLAFNKIKLSANLNDSGYVLKIRLPFELFGYEVPPISEEHILTIGFTAIYIDVDNEFRPEEVSWIATSRFEDNKPSTFGELAFINDYKKFSFAHNIYLDAILKELENFGF